MHRGLDDPKELLSILLGFITTSYLCMKMFLHLKIYIEVGVTFCGILNLLLNTSSKEKRGEHK